LDAGPRVAELAEQGLVQTTKSSVGVMATCPIEECFLERNAVAGKHAREGRPSELRTLVGAKDVGLAVTRQRILQCFDAECRVHGDRQPP
jgi:hypothetical protein